MEKMKIDSQRTYMNTITTRIQNMVGFVQGFQQQKDPEQETKTANPPKLEANTEVRRKERVRRGLVLTAAALIWPGIVLAE